MLSTAFHSEAIRGQEFYRHELLSWALWLQQGGGTQRDLPADLPCILLYFVLLESGCDYNGFCSGCLYGDHL